MYSIRFNDYYLGRKDYNKWWLKSSISKPNDRSYMTDGIKKDLEYHTFIDEIHNWFKDNNIKYKLKCISNVETEIIFNNETDAILFKLTWM